MKLEDLETVRALAEKRRGHRAILARIDNEEPFRMTIGAGGNVAEVVLRGDIIDTLRDRIGDDLEREVADIDSRLRALGVDDGSTPDPDAPAGARSAHPVLSSDAAVPAELTGKDR